MDSLRNNPSGNQRTDSRSRRAVLQNADSQIMPLLTDQQKQLYQQWKAQQKQRMMQKRQNNGNNNPDDSPYNSQ
jgi:Spy/CpxP family protein refolding chaperone